MAMNNPHYTDTHRLFLQAVISRRFMKESAAIQLYAHVCQATKGMSPLPICLDKRGSLFEAQKLVAKTTNRTPMACLKVTFYS
jgi:hypothetical protein